MIRYEYKMVELEMPAELTAAIARTFMGDPLPPEMRKQLNVYVEKELNKLGKNGWLLHNNGLNSLPTLLFFKPSGVKNV